jgi:NADH:ubiquinone oxidoreductase subunit E
MIKSLDLIKGNPVKVMETEKLNTVLFNPLQDAKAKAEIDAILEKNKDKPGSIMVILNELQNTVGFVSEELQQYVADYLHTPVSKIHGVISFYSFFTTQPRGKHIIKICLGTACYVGGASQLIEKIKQLIGIGPGETNADWTITVEECRCVGACSQAPVVVIDDEIHGRVKPSTLAKLLRTITTEEKIA